MTPPAVENPGMEVHIHPFQLHSVRENKNQPLYLHTSPEFALKRLLASDEKIEKLFSVSYCFRDEPRSPIHRNQFLMLEWYRKNERYEKIMEDVEGLLEFCKASSSIPLRQNLVSSKMVKKTMQELFREFLDIDILNFLDTSSIKKLLQTYPDVPVPNVDLEWDDYFFLLFLNKIETHLKQYPLLMIYEFPAPLSALSNLKKSDPRVCERFEVYVDGTELCNCFNELTDEVELRKRFELQNEMKQKIYGYELPKPEGFYGVMKNYPPSAGVALGVERLLHSLFQVEEPFFD